MAGDPEAGAPGKSPCTRRWWAMSSRAEGGGRLPDGAPSLGGGLGPLGWRLTLGLTGVRLAPGGDEVPAARGAREGRATGVPALTAASTPTPASRPSAPHPPPASFSPPELTGWHAHQDHFCEIPALPQPPPAPASAPGLPSSCLLPEPRRTGSRGYRSSATQGASWALPSSPSACLGAGDAPRGAETPPYRLRLPLPTCCCWDLGPEPGATQHHCRPRALASSWGAGAPQFPQHDLPQGCVGRQQLLLPRLPCSPAPPRTRPCLTPWCTQQSR